MSALRRHRLPLVLRVFVLTLFALSLGLQPVLASAAEIHELAHDPTGGHAHVEHSDTMSDEVAADDQENGAAGTLHMLLHFAHCCGQSAAAMNPVPFAMPTPTTSTKPLLHEPQALLSARILAPFRPPISA